MENKVKILQKLLLVIAFLALASCEQYMLPDKPMRPAGYARLLAYVHSSSKAPLETEFTITSLELRNPDGTYVTLTDTQFTLNSNSIKDVQLFLKETFIAPGSYNALKVAVSGATVRRESGVSELSLTGDGDGGGEYVFDLNLDIEADDSQVLQLAWDPKGSLEGGDLFKPSLKLLTQSAVATEKMLFVSNSGSDYLTIIDRAVERVIAALTVGERPTGMALNSLKDRLYVLSSEESTVKIVDTYHFQVIDSIHLVSGNDPQDLVYLPESAVVGDGKLYIINSTSNDVSVVDTASQRIIRTIQVGLRPSHIATNPERKEVYVVNSESNNISIISTIDETVSATIDVGFRPTGVAVGSNDKIYVFNEGGATIAVVSTARRQVIDTIADNNPPVRGWQGFDDKLFVLSRSSDVLSIYSSFGAKIRTLYTGGGPIGLIGDRNLNRLYVVNSKDSTLQVFDPVAERSVKKLTVGELPYGIVQLER